MRTIQDLRTALFEQLDRLKTSEDPLELERAKRVADVARVIVDSAKVEVDALRITKSHGSGFIPVEQLPATSPPASPTGPVKVWSGRQPLGGA